MLLLRVTFVFLSIVITYSSVEADWLFADEGSASVSDDENDLENDNEMSSGSEAPTEGSADTDTPFIVGATTLVGILQNCMGY